MPLIMTMAMKKIAGQGCNVGGNQKDAGSGRGGRQEQPVQPAEAFRILVIAFSKKKVHKESLLPRATIVRPPFAPAR